jgi:phage anti-repressor protein
MSSAEHKGLVPVMEQVIGGVRVQTVDARNLHGALGVRKDFTNWAKQQITRLRLHPDRDYRGEVYAPQGENPQGGRPTTSYWFTLDAAKHIAMMANTDRGYEVREYFIECERKAHGDQGAIRQGTVNPTGEVIAMDPAWAAWLALPLEERRQRHRDALAYKQAGGVVMMRWAMWNQGYAIPPRYMLGAVAQYEMELAKRQEQRGAITITVPYSEGTH